MTGLEKILNEVQQAAETEASALVQEGRMKAEDIRTKAEEETQSKTEALMRDATKEMEAILSGGVSGTELQVRQQTLAVKQELIADTLEQAKQGVLALTPAKYFALFAKMAKEISETGAATLSMNQKDLKRMPKKFLSNFSEEIEVSIDPQPSNISGGFLLTFGDIINNCSVDALFAKYHDKFTDAIQEILF